MAENNAITEIKIGGKLVPYIKDDATNTGAFFIVDSNDISFENGVTSVTEKVKTINTDLIETINGVSADLTKKIDNKYIELLDKITKNQNDINIELTSIRDRLSVLEMAVSGDTTKVELELTNPPVYTKGEYTVKAKAHVYNGDEVQSYKWYINDKLQSFESNEFTKSYDNNTRDAIKYDIKCIIITKNGITVVSDILEVTVPGITLDTISITPKTSSITESNRSLTINVSNFISQNYKGDKKFECKWEILGNTDLNDIFIIDGDKKTVAWSSVENGISNITIQSGTVSDKKQQSITIQMTPQLGDGDISTNNLENINIGEPINITIKVGKNEVINYYWYVGQNIPSNIGTITNATTDKWTELGTSLSGVSEIYIETPNSFGIWYVLMPNGLTGFVPGDGASSEESIWDKSSSSISGYTLWTKKAKALKLATTFKKY